MKKNTKKTAKKTSVKKKKPRKPTRPKTMHCWLLVQVHSDGDVRVDTYASQNDCENVLAEEQHYLPDLVIDGYCMQLDLPIPTRPTSKPLPGRLGKLSGKLEKP